MAIYYFNKNTDDRGNHEVHVISCTHCPEDALFIGVFSTCEEALQQASTTHTSKSFDGCSHCCKDCHND